MTTDQIKIFNDFLSERTLYYTFYECLQKAPLEQTYAKKEVYLMRVSPLLALNYGFWQDRGVNRVKEADWRHLREDWIARAAEAGILGKDLIGVEPKNIVSAINAEFNGKQFSGSLNDVDKYTNRIAMKAIAIQDMRDEQINRPVSDEMVELLKIINDHSVRPPAEVYTAAMLDQRVKICLRKVFEDAKYSGKKNYLTKRYNELTNSITSNQPALIAGSIEAMQSLCEDMTAAIDTARQLARTEFNEGLVEYEKCYLQWQEKVRKAKDRLEELKRQADHSQQEVSKAESEKPEQSDAAPETSATHSPSTNPDEQVIVLRPTPTAARRISLSPTQFSCSYDPSSRSGVHYRITINSTLSKRLIESGTMYYHLVARQDKIFLRFSPDYAASQRVNVASKGNSCTICDKLLIEYLRKHFGITSRTMIINVVEDKNEAAPNILCELQSAIAVSFQ